MDIFKFEILKPVPPFHIFKFTYSLLDTLMCSPFQLPTWIAIHVLKLHLFNSLIARTDNSYYIYNYIHIYIYEFEHLEVGRGSP